MNFQKMNITQGVGYKAMRTKTLKRLFVLTTLMMLPLIATAQTCPAAPVGDVKDPVFQLVANASDRFQIGATDSVSSTIKGAMVWDDSNSTIAVCDGTNWVTLGSGGGGADNLGDHVATQNIVLGNHYLSGDGGDEGISVSNSGVVSISSTENYPLTLTGPNGTGANWRAISFADTDIGPTWSIGPYTRGTSVLNSSNDFVIYQTVNAAGTAVNQVRFTVDDTGNIGIGTDSPSSTLHVAGGTYFGVYPPERALISSWAAGSDIDNLLPGSSPGPVLEGGFNSHMVFSLQDNDSNDGFYFIGTGGDFGTDNTRDTMLLAVKSDGSVGISNHSPSSTLHVGGNIQMGNSGQACIAARAGAMRYNGGAIEFCNGTAWAALGVSGGGDNLGSHIAGQNIQLGNYYLNGDGGDEGLSVANNGNVTLSDNLFVEGALVVLGNNSASNSTLRHVSNASRVVMQGGSSFNDGASMILNGVNYSSGASGQLDFRAVRDTSNDDTLMIFRKRTTAGANTTVAEFQSDGNFILASSVQVSDDTDSCVASKAGTIRYNTGNVEFCNGTAWAALSNSGADNLGDHTATANLDMQDNKIVFDAGDQVMLHSSGDGFKFKRVSDFFGSTKEAFVFDKIDGGALDPDGGFAFVNTGSDDVSETAVVIRGSGNVGIGTKEPSSTLHVAGDIQIGNDSAACAATTAGAMRYNSGNVEFCNGTAWAGLGGGGDNLGSHIASQNIQLGNYYLSGDGGDEGIFVANDGNVGIGTVSPTVELEVDGLIQSNRIRLNSIGVNNPEIYFTGGAATGHVSGLQKVAIIADADDSMADTGTVFAIATANGSLSSTDDAPGYEELLTFTKAGSLGIGTASPQGKLHVTDRTGNEIYIQSNVSNGADILMENHGFLNAEGFLYIGLDANGGSTAKLKVVNETTSDPGSATSLFEVDESGNVVAAGTVTATGFVNSSDKRLKDDIHTVMNPLEIIKKLRGVFYKWKDSGRESAGVIAQEVREVMPGAVHEREDGMLAVEYNQLIAPMIEAIKMQQEQIEALKAEVEELKKAK